MKNGEKEGFDVSPPSFGVSAYREEIEKWRNDFRDIAAGALEMQGIEESERDNLKRAVKSLRSIDELVKFIGERPYTHVQAYALSHLWGAIGAAFIIGSRGIENPLTQKFLKDKWAQSTAQARSAKPSIRNRDQINEVVTRHCADLWKKKPTRAGSKRGTAEDILEGVNSEMAKSRIKPFSLEGLRKLIVLP
jgi:hypothetical protein